MAIDIVTKEDLQYFKVQLLKELKEFVMDLKKDSANSLIESYKTKHVRKILSCSVNTLNTLRISGKLRWKKEGGTIYYKREDVHRLRDEGFKQDIFNENIN